MLLARNIAFLRPSNISLCTRSVFQHALVYMKWNKGVYFKFNSTLSSETFMTRPCGRGTTCGTGNTVINKVDGFLIEYLENLGANMTKIRKEIKLSKLDGKINFGPVVDVLQDQCGLEPKEIGQMLSKRPRILLLSEKKVTSCIDMLKGAGLKKDDVASMLTKSPGILTCRVEDTFDAKMDTLYNLHVLPPFSKNNILKIIKRCPALLSTCSPESLEDKVDFMHKNLGFNRRQLKNMLVKQPSILTFSPENIKAKFEYCFQDMGMDIPDIARCPRVWQCSLKRLRERYLFLQHLRVIANNTHIDDFGLGKIITPSDKVFAETVAKKSLVEFQEFAKTI